MNIKVTITIGEHTLELTPGEVRQLRNALDCLDPKFPIPPFDRKLNPFGDNERMIEAERQRQAFLAAQQRAVEQHVSTNQYRVK